VASKNLPFIFYNIVGPIGTILKSSRRCSLPFCPHLSSPGTQLATKGSVLAMEKTLIRNSMSFTGPAVLALIVLRRGRHRLMRQPATLHASLEKRSGVGDGQTLIRNSMSLNRHHILALNVLEDGAIASCLTPATLRSLLRS